MRCKKCGEEIREGCLFCHKCGEEVRMVPDYEPDLEELQIKLSGEKKKEKRAEKQPAENEPAKQKAFFKIVKGRYFASAVLLLVSLSAFVGAYFSMLKKRPPEAIQGQEKADPPIFSPEGGDYGYYLSVELTAQEGQKIYYTTDGSVPDKTSPVYQSPIELSEGMTVVRAFAVDGDGNESEMAEAAYLLEFGSPDAPEIFPKSGEYTEETYVKIIVPDGCAGFYTLDGSEPTEYSELYTGEFLMPEGSSTIRAVVIDRKGAVSEITSAQYYRKTAEVPEGETADE